MILVTVTTTLKIIRFYLLYFTFRIQQSNLGLLQLIQEQNLLLTTVIYRPVIMNK